MGAGVLFARNKGPVVSTGSTPYASDWPNMTKDRVNGIEWPNNRYGIALPSMLPIPQVPNGLTVANFAIQETTFKFRGLGRRFLKTLKAKWFLTGPADYR